MIVRILTLIFAIIILSNNTMVKAASNEEIYVAEGIKIAAGPSSSIDSINVGAYEDKIGNLKDAVNWINDNVSEINEAILDYAKNHHDSTGLGTTLVLALVTPDFLIFGNIGDSSGYVLKNKRLHKVTKDHTLVSLLVEAGDLTEEEAKNHPKKNVLMKALGAGEKVDMDIFDVERDVDGIFLCSDGVTNMLTTEQIEKVLEEELTIEEKVKKIIRKCNARGGQDNISVAFLDMKSGCEQ